MTCKAGLWKNLQPLINFLGNKKDVQLKNVRENRLRTKKDYMEITENKVIK